MRPGGLGGGRVGGSARVCVCVWGGGGLVCVWELAEFEGPIVNLMLIFCHGALGQQKPQDVLGTAKVCERERQRQRQ